MKKSNLSKEEIKKLLIENNEKIKEINKKNKKLENELEEFNIIDKKNSLDFLNEKSKKFILAESEKIGYFEYLIYDSTKAEKEIEKMENNMHFLNGDFTKKYYIFFELEKYNSNYETFGNFVDYDEIPKYIDGIIKNCRNRLLNQLYVYEFESNKFLDIEVKSIILIDKW